MTNKDKLELYLNYLRAIQYHQEYGDKYGDTKELIEIYEKKLEIKKDERKNNKVYRNIRSTSKTK